jgi:hypothetical protein
MKQQRFPIPPWLLLEDAVGMGLIVVGVLALFAGMADSLGALGDPVVASACLVVGVVLVGGSAVQIVLHLRAREGERQHGARRD